MKDLERAMQRHAEHLGAWLEADVRPSRSPKRILLGSVLILLLLAGAYVVLEDRPVTDTPVPVEAGDQAVRTSVVTVDDPIVGDSSAPNVTTLVTGNTNSPATLPLREDRAAAQPVRPSVVDRGAPATVTVQHAGAAPSGVLQILVTPWAFVSIDGRVGLRRARGADTLVAGIPHRVLFQRPGFATRGATVTLRPGERRLLEVQMTPINP